LVVVAVVTIKEHQMELHQVVVLVVAALEMVHQEFREVLLELLIKVLLVEQTVTFLITVAQVAALAALVEIKVQLEALV
jgi:hypothetical protein